MSLWERWHFFQNAYLQNTIINKKLYKIKIILPAQSLEMVLQLLHFSTAKMGISSILYTLCTF